MSLPSPGTNSAAATRHSPSASRLARLPRRHRLRDGLRGRRRGLDDALEANGKAAASRAIESMTSLEEIGNTFDTKLQFVVF